MNWDRIEENWKQLKGNARQQWGRLVRGQPDVGAGKPPSPVRASESLQKDAPPPDVPQPK